MIASLHGNASPHVTAPTWQSCIPFSLTDISYLLGMVSNSDQLGFLCCYIHARCTPSFLLCQHLLDILCCVCVAAHIQNAWFAQLLQEVTTDTHVSSAISLCSMLVLHMWVPWQSAALHDANGAYACSWVVVCSTACDPACSGTNGVPLRPWCCMPSGSLRHKPG